MGEPIDRLLLSAPIANALTPLRSKNGGKTKMPRSLLGAISSENSAKGPPVK